MASKTGIIKFNVTERGRRFRGVERNFDAAAMAQLINSGAVQERVKNGDMIGYYGHLIREKFGLNPRETAFIDGKQVSLEPAIRTTYLKAHPDGTLEHETEFLDTVSGKLAARLWKTKTGGWSSAIDIRRMGDKSLPLEFYGFDYVLEPNFTHNRGYALDDAGEPIFDEVAQQSALLDAVNKMLDAADAEKAQLKAAYDQATQALEAVTLENAELMSMATKAGKSEVRLDGLNAEVLGTRDSSFKNADSFLHRELVGFEAPEPEKPSPETRAAGTVLGRMFRV